MLRVMTLPITPRNSNSFLTLTTSLVADVYAKAFCAELTVVLNTVGIKSESSGISPTEQYKNYQYLLSRLGMNPAKCEHDGSDLYESFFQSEVSRMEGLSFLQRSKRDIAWCSCGRVEIPVDVALKIISEQRQKTLISGSSFGGAKCIACDSFLVSGNEEVMHINLHTATVLAEPLLYSRELATITERTSKRDIIITRRHRGPNERFDIDFRWYGYVGCFANPGDEVVIVTSPTTLNQAIKVLLYCQIAYPEITIRLFIHPLIRIADHKVTMSTMSTQEFFDFLVIPIQARMFLSLGMQWTTPESFIGTDEVYLIKQTSQKITDYNCVGVDCITGSLCNIFTRNNVNSLFKQVRCGRVLSRSQNQLVSFIQPLT